MWETANIHLHLHLCIARFLAFGSNINTMSANVCRVLQTQVNVSEETCSCVPATRIRFARVCINGDGVHSSILQHLRHIDLKAQITIFRGGYLLSVDIHISVVHQAFHIEHDLQSFPLFGGGKCLSVPTLATILPTSCATCFLIPGLFELEVVGKVEHAPFAVVEFLAFCSFGITQLEAPIKVEELLALSFE